MGDRHQFRAEWHHYNEGIYFITICARDKAHLFGEIVDDVFFPSQLGDIVSEHIATIPLHYNDVELLNHVVMPNHIHMVLYLAPRDSAQLDSTSGANTSRGCLHAPNHLPQTEDYHHNSRLSVIIGAFKAGVTRDARTRLIASLPVWQSRFHDHIIRHQHAFENIMNYIDTNVENWAQDCFS